MSRMVHIFLILMILGCDKGGVIVRNLAEKEDVSDVLDVENFMETLGITDISEKGNLSDSFVTKPYIPEQSFRFELSGREGDRFIVDVMAHQFDKVFGFALRIEWDASKLKLESVNLQEVFNGGVHKASEIRPGSLAIGCAFLGNKNEKSIDGDLKIATLVFSPLSKEGVELRFFAEKSLVISRDWEKKDVKYLSATLYP